MLPASVQGSRLGHSPAWEITSRGLEELFLCVCKLPGVHLMYAGAFVHKPGGVSRCLHLYLQTVGLIEIMPGLILILFRDTGDDQTLSESKVFNIYKPCLVTYPLYLPIDFHKS